MKERLTFSQIFAKGVRFVRENFLLKNLFISTKEAENCHHDILAWAIYRRWVDIVVINNSDI